jgi:hypothetical protein
MNHLAKLLLTLVSLVLIIRAYGGDFSDASGIDDACAAGALLDVNHVPYKVVVFGSGSRSEAGCIYQVNGVSYLYTPAGSAKINPDEVSQIPLERVSRDDVFRISDGNHRIHNGCLVFATCAYAQYKRNPHIAWAGIIAVQVINVDSLGGDGPGLTSLTGHAITAFEDDNRQIFIQENGEDPKKLDQMTELAQAGDKSWHDSSTLVYCDHHIQGLTSFKDEFGRPR